MVAFGRPASAWAPVHILVREADLRDRPLSDGLPFIQASIGAEAGDLSGSVEKRDASIMIFQHPDRRLDEVIAAPACRDLQDEPVLSDRIVSPRNPLVVDAQEVLQIAHTGHESRSLPGGGLDRPDPLKPQQGWQALLQCQERDAAHACACDTNGHLHRPTCAQSRMPIDLIVSGNAMSLFHASHAASIMAS
jgi:hypothetical protein